MLCQYFSVGKTARMQTQIQAVVAGQDMEMQVEHGLPGGSIVKLHHHDAFAGKGPLDRRGDRLHSLDTARQVLWLSVQQVDGR